VISLRYHDEDHRNEEIRMTEPSESGGKPSDITRLLFKAVKALPEDEQQAIFAYFLEHGLGVRQPPFFEQFIQEGARRATDEVVASARDMEARRLSVVNMLTAKPTGPHHQVIPVRLSEDSHRRLKEWCAEHNFPMAVVVRGLIDRFLDSWQERAAS
jgi:hypothetical protein